MGSELTLVDAAAGRIWFRGIDALQLCTDRRFEEVASLLWTGDFEGTRHWRARPASIEAGRAAQGGLADDAPADERLARIVCALTTASGHASSGTASATDLMASVVDGLPGPDHPGSLAARLAAKLAPSEVPKAMVDVLDAVMCLLCEEGLTTPALIARLAASLGGGAADAVASAMPSAAAQIRSLAHLEDAFAVCATDGPTYAADTLDREALRLLGSHAPFKGADPRSAIALPMLLEASSDRTTIGPVAEELERRIGGPPSMLFVVAALASACNMPAGSAAAIVLVARSAGWIAHAIEETRHPTPYRPRIAYTGHAPRSSTPRRTLDAVQSYLTTTRPFMP